MNSFGLDIGGLAETDVLGHRLGELLFPGAVIALIGPLGAGKTYLCRAIAEGLGIQNSRVVTSPTFTLIQEYQARLPIFHFDAYRLGGADDFVDLGIHEYFDAGGVCLIEWADHVHSVLPGECLTIEIEPVDEVRRGIQFKASGERSGELLKRLADTYGTRS